MLKLFLLMSLLPPISGLEGITKHFPHTFLRHPKSLAYRTQIKIDVGLKSHQVMKSKG